MLKKYLYILTIVILQFLNIYPQPTWEKIKTPTDFNLLKVFYLDSLHCWVAGDSGVIMFSSDEGENWEIQNSGVSNFISDIFFLNKDLGWALTFGIEGSNSDIRSKVLKTTNGGIDWQNENYRHLNTILTTIFFNDSLNGWIGGEPFDISYTNDGGSNWNHAVIDTGNPGYFPVYRIKFSNFQYGFAVGGAEMPGGIIWRTVDGGNLWKTYRLGADPFNDMIFLDSVNVLSLSADPERSYPIGELKFDLENNFWTYNEIDKYGRVSSISQRTPLEIWGTLSCDTSFILSKDIGTTWDFLPTNDSLCYYSIAFADSLHGIAVGRGGYILKYIPEIPVNVENADSQFPLDFVLEQNYPNPFNPGTKICWHSPISGYHTLKVYDVLGNVIATLVDEYKPAGRYEVEFNVGQSAIGGSSPDIASGIYFYQLKSDNYFETKKMLLLK